jgi:hypothetical protein
LPELLDAITLACAAIVAVALGALAVGTYDRLRMFDGKVLAVSGVAGRDGQPEALFSAAHGLLRTGPKRWHRGQPPLVLEIVGRGSEVRFGLWVASAEEDHITAMLRGAYPGIELRDDDSADLPGIRLVAGARLAHAEALPIGGSPTADGLPLLVAALAAVSFSASVTIGLIVRPTGRRWNRRARARAQMFRDRRRGPGIGVSQDDRERARAIEEKATAAPFETYLEIASIAPSKESATRSLDSVIATFGVFGGPNRLLFTRARVRPPDRLQGRRRFPVARGFVLTAGELARLWHLPREVIGEVENVLSPKVRAPAGAFRGERVIGLSSWGDGGGAVHLSIPDSRHHLHVLGATGTGKTTVLLNLALQDIIAGRGVAVLDPKGDLVRALLARIPADRADDVILIAPDDGSRTVGLNPLEVLAPDDPDLIVENTLTIFKRIYERSWGMRTDDILKAALITLVRRGGMTLAHIPVLLTDPVFRLRTVGELNDPLGLDSFWIWFGRLTEHQRNEAIGPVLNKLRDFLVRPRLRRVLCQVHSTIDARRIVDSGQILLADLSVGRWGETASSLVGSFLVAKLWQAVLGRSSVDENLRRDFYLFIDEFHHFLGMPGPFGDALAEARGLRLSLALANQHLGQLPREIRDAVASNARSRLVFQCGQDDATYLAREFAPLDATALMSLPRFEMAARLSISGQTSRPFTMRTIAPSPPAGPLTADEIRVASLARFGREGAEIDRELRATFDVAGPPPAGQVGVRRRQR